MAKKHSLDELTSLLSEREDVLAEVILCMAGKGIDIPRRYIDTSIRFYEKAERFYEAGEFAEKVGLAEKAIANYILAKRTDCAARAAKKAGLAEQAKELYTTAMNEYEATEEFGKASDMAEEAGLKKEAIEYFAKSIDSMINIFKIKLKLKVKQEEKEIKKLYDLYLEEVKKLEEKYIITNELPIK